MKAALVRSAEERCLHAAVLITERDLQVKHLLAVTLEAEVSRLDHARVHGSDRDLMHFLSFDAIEVGHAALWVHACRPAPGIAAAPGRMEANRLEPWMTIRSHAPLLGDLPVEQVDLGTLPCHRCEGFADHSRAHGFERAPSVVGETEG